MKNEALLPEGWPRPKGYANGVAAAGRQLFVAGQVGWTPQMVFESDDFAAQTRQALANIVAVLRAGGAKPEHIVRMTWYVTSKREYLASYKSIGKVYRELIGRHYPAMTAVEVAALVEDEAKVEIEATAVIPDEDVMPSRQIRSD
jgi:enamine deaminase RidA (YjgF/YER057c/UK114 family)